MLQIEKMHLRFMSLRSPEPCQNQALGVEDLLEDSRAIIHEDIQTWQVSMGQLRRTVKAMTSSKVNFGY